MWSPISMAASCQGDLSVRGRTAHDRVVQLPPGQADGGRDRRDGVTTRLAVPHPDGYLPDRLVEGNGGARGAGPGDNQGYLAEGAGGGDLGQLGERAADDFLVRLGQLAADHGPAVRAERGGQIGQRRGQPP